MHKIMLAIVLMVGFIPLVNATNETRIYETDSIDTVKANKPHRVILKDGRILPTDSIGTKITGSKHQYKIIKDRIYETDSIGAVKQDKSLKIK